MHGSCSDSKWSGSSLLADTLATALVRTDGATTGADHAVRGCGFWVSKRVRFSNGSLLPSPVVYLDEEMSSSCPRLFSSCCLSRLKGNYQTFWRGIWLALVFKEYAYLSLFNHLCLKRSICLSFLILSSSHLLPLILSKMCYLILWTLSFFSLNDI